MDLRQPYEFLYEFTANQDRLAEILAFHTDLKGAARTLLAVQDGQLGLVRTGSPRRLLSTWRNEVGSAERESSQEFAHYANTWLPLLQMEADITQINNKTTEFPGSQMPYQGAPVPLSPERTDHRPLIRTRAPSTDPPIRMRHGIALRLQA